MSLRLPDFIVAGAPRSGTTWLYHLLDRHPGVEMAKPARPEPKFFLVDDLYAKGLAFYSRTWFEAIPPGVLAGEKSTNYLEAREVAARVHADIPSVKLIFVLRDPVERAWSNYRWSRMNGLETESFGEALRLEPERELSLPQALRYSRPHAYFSRGLYADLLAPYFERFDRRHILCLRYEDLASEPEEAAARAFAFLGLDVAPGLASAVGVVNAADALGPVPERERDVLVERYAEPNRRLAALLDADFRVWRAA